MNAHTEDTKCVICQTTFPVVKYRGGTCPKCGQVYEWEEGFTPVLTEKQRGVLLSLNNDIRTLELSGGAWSAYGIHTKTGESIITGQPRSA